MVTQHEPPPPRGGLLVAVETLTAIHDRYDSAASDRPPDGSGDAPWPGGDGNLHDRE
ncbi:hypothetical protein SMALB_3501 [Streptomyces malaysiensis]|uniref:Uncharacterized protein n=1 Tax=Streptomyces malaysiensis TaxID=92644 RepID=A0A7X5X2M3_STRMQ|nr:hypothetical protein [Streptomyces malaysiensis]